MTAARPWTTIEGHLEEAEKLLHSARYDQGITAEAAIACGTLAQVHVALATFYASFKIPDVGYLE